MDGENVAWALMIIIIRCYYYFSFLYLSIKIIYIHIIITSEVNTTVQFSVNWCKLINKKTFVTIMKTTNVWSSEILISTFGEKKKDWKTISNVVLFVMRKECNFKRGPFFNRTVCAQMLRPISISISISDLWAIKWTWCFDVFNL